MSTVEFESQLKEALSRNPHDFSAWEQLLQVNETKVAKALAEAPRTKMTIDTMPESLRRAIQGTQKTYDEFLGRFPYCFGYWKKYAEFEMVHEGDVKAREVYERGVGAFPNSVDLWIQYCTFVTKITKNPTEVRGLYERGVECIGLDFMAHSFYDIYLEWEENRAIEQNSYSRTLSLLDRLIRIPMQQYQRYYERYQQIANVRNAREMVSAEEYQVLRKRVIGEMKTRQVKNIRDDAVDSEIKQIVLNDRAGVFSITEEKVKKRWQFEENIKRPYFHVKPLDEGQIINWNKYLDFEESEGDAVRIISLYERCLISCAFYEEFWIRYSKYLILIQDYERAENVFIRSVYTFIPESQPKCLISFVYFKESQGKINEARELLNYYLQKRPGQLQVLIEYANFEKRNKSFQDGLKFISSWLESVDEVSKPFLYSFLAKNIWIYNKEINKAREMFIKGIQETTDKFLLFQYIQFEVTNNNLESKENVLNIFNLIKDYSFPIHIKKQVVEKICDFLIDCGCAMKE
ncbi:hypothetical protein ROZALSC1DRAFT_28892 [Rozella allomycis CSF55]|uniref:Suppressor of forked domain-containing protein n=1 Tax=Rozella allomycis (strain CSF55) TaxID=988480 RepID=A0A4P9YJE6_ROZAC|nr:hypothetical protein ROZALSC1DRAFT_28892 [Rozella allomycis CSF55]